YPSRSKIGAAQHKQPLLGGAGGFGRHDEHAFRMNANHRARSDDDDDIRGKSSAQSHVVVTITLALSLLSFFSIVPNANAGFGPSSGATTSPPPNLLAPKIDSGDDIVTQNKKLRQLIGSTLDEGRLQQFSEQLDNLTESLKRLITEDEEDESELSSIAADASSESSDDDTTKKMMTTTTSITSKEEQDAKKRLLLKQQIATREQELEKARMLQQQIADREKLLATLEKQPYWFNYLAAFIGSVASTLVMHPVDTVKTRMQIKQQDDNDDDEGEGEGGNILSLYEGLYGNILKEGPPSALYLGIYESVKYYLYNQFGFDYRLLIYLTAGAAGEMCGSIIRAPAEAIKSTVQSGLSSSAVDAAYQLFGTPESRKNVIRAWSSSVWRDVPFGAIQLAIFELTKTYILNNPDIDFDSSTLLSEAIIGAFAGGWGALLTTPFDIITTRIITQSVDEEGYEPLGVWDMLKQVYIEGIDSGEGLKVFFVGWEARVGYWAPAISIFLSCYCSVRQAGVTQGWF
ncbi:hypothetical protein ACHAWC_005825, partial [Mediolabrus comicus]